MKIGPSCPSPFWAPPNIEFLGVNRDLADFQAKALLLWTSGPELPDHASLLIVLDHAARVVGAVAGLGHFLDVVEPVEWLSQGSLPWSWMRSCARGCTFCCSLTPRLPVTNGLLRFDASCATYPVVLDPIVKREWCQGS